MTSQVEAQKRSNGSHHSRDGAEDTQQNQNEEKEKSNSHEGTDTHAHKPHKRRKVNHACVYCRRSHMTCDLERPCARCIKRDIGHLCHDEPREPGKRTKSDADHRASIDKIESPNAHDRQYSQDQYDEYPNENGMNMETIKPPISGIDAAQIVQPKPVSPNQMPRPPHSNQSYMNFNAWDFGIGNQFNDVHNLHPYNTFNTSEVTNEYNLLGDFLSNSLMDDGGTYNANDTQAMFSDPLLTTGSISTYAQDPQAQENQQGNSSLAQPQVQAGNEISRPSSAFPGDQKAREKFYMTAADPAGNDTPEERMNKLLKAKYDAGMLKPFNYVKGYARLNHYMERNMRPASRQKILRQLDRFRPKFREAMHHLTDIQLVKVEMWFERSLMEYDRVFASMAIPACCWRRTGEIFRGNKEMAELIHVPMEKLRDVRYSNKRLSVMNVLMI